MEKVRSFEELFQRKLGGEEGVVSSGERFLGVFSADVMPELERFLRADLGVFQGRRRRPFIGRFEKEFYILIFLTTKTYSRRVVDLRFCNNRGKGACKNLEINCFVLKDRNRKEVLAYAVHKERFKNFSFQFCGVCRDLEFLDSFR
ncbi:MAG: hypothetical protein ACK42C_03850, partial [Aquificaceae bacterium]